MQGWSYFPLLYQTVVRKIYRLTQKHCFLELFLIDLLKLWPVVFVSWCFPMKQKIHDKLWRPFLFGIFVYH